MVYTVWQFGKAGQDKVKISEHLNAQEARKRAMGKAGMIASDEKGRVLR